MNLYLPHLPQKLDVRICSVFSDFFVIHPYCRPFKIREMSKSNKSSMKNTPIDLNSIFGVIRSG